MPPDKSWMNQHFGSDGRPPAPAPKTAESRAGFWFGIGIAVIVLAMAAVGTVDYTGTLPIGLVEQVGMHPRSPRQEPTWIAPPAPSTPTASSAAPAGSAGWDLFGTALDPATEERTQHAVEESMDSEREITGAIAVPPDRQATERAASLRRGIDLMERELGKVRQDAVFHAFQVTIRPQMREPYSAAERVKLANGYLASQRRWTNQELLYIRDERTRSQAQVDNAYTRLRELDRKAKSLRERIDKAKADLDAVAVTP